jgi:hypothetical protein
LIHADRPHCGQTAHVAVIDGSVLTISIIPNFSHIAFAVYAFLSAPSIANNLDAVTARRKSNFNKCATVGSRS